MRAVAVMHLADAGGPAQHVLPWLEELAGHDDLEVVVPGAGRVERWYRRFATTTIMQYEPLVLSRRPLDFLRLNARLARETAMFGRYFAATRPDLVIVITSVVPSALFGAVLSGVPRIVYVAELFDRGFVGGYARRLGFAVLRRAIGRGATGVVACSRNVERQFADYSDRTLIRTIYPGVSPVPVRAKSEARARLGVDSGPCIAVAGNINEARGQDLLLRALPVIRAEYPGVRCLLAGATLPRGRDARYRTHLERLALDTGVRDAVVFAGFVEPVEDVYAAADVVVNPARFNEPLGRVALEALVAERPVVVTDVGAAHEVLRDGVDAIFVPRDDSEALAAAVIALLADPSLRGRLVQAGRSRVLREFSEQRGRAEFSAFVREVLASSSNPNRRS